MEPPPECECCFAMSTMQIDTGKRASLFCDQLFFRVGAHLPWCKVKNGRDYAVYLADKTINKKLKSTRHRCVKCHRRFSRIALLALRVCRSRPWRTPLNRQLQMVSGPCTTMTLCHTWLYKPQLLPLLAAPSNNKQKMGGHVSTLLCYSSLQSPLYPHNLTSIMNRTFHTSMINSLFILEIPLPPYHHPTMKYMYTIPSPSRRSPLILPSSKKDWQIANNHFKRHLH